ncbi:hypothetical protein ABK040_010348 [Willaertia magna]
MLKRSLQSGIIKQTSSILTIKTTSKWKRNFGCSLLNLVNKELIDYSLYVVTDTLQSNQQNRTIEETIQLAIEGGASIVQYREKSNNLSNREIYQTAKRLKEITQFYQIPLIINDRVDIALAIDADGVHVGQSDLPPKDVRKLIGQDKILGVTVGNEEELNEAIMANADYIGTNAIFSSVTKKDTDTIGLKGVQHIMELKNSKKLISDLKVVGIGGLKKENVKQVLNCGIDGVAVVNSIIGQKDVISATKELRHLIDLHKNNNDINLTRVKENFRESLRQIKKKRPLIHNITNYVVANQSANALLSIGASPIMSLHPKEMENLVNISNALLINIGTLNDISIEANHLAAKTATKLGKPIVLDPVGFGATDERTRIILDLLSNYNISIIKGNLGEICKLYSVTFNDSQSNERVQIKGVDSEGEVNLLLKKRMVKELAKKYNCVVCVTGEVDLISDGKRMIQVNHNEPNLRNLTGIGCITGSIQASFSAVCDDPLISASAGIAYVALCGELAGSRLRKKLFGKTEGTVNSIFKPALPNETFREKLFDQFGNLTVQQFYQFLDIEYSEEF